MEEEEEDPKRSELEEEEEEMEVEEKWTAPEWILPYQGQTHFTIRHSIGVWFFISILCLETAPLVLAGLIPFRRFTLITQIPYVAARVAATLMLLITDDAPLPEGDFTI
ncbi:hypothetical protein Tco_0417995 [Tanacetum coccineum]|uniref:Uncharacterized protein n=1 Tax=Tanacetum coccineum TaxID=301880 RepID=A0ABQ5IU38_9ASTR